MTGSIDLSIVRALEKHGARSAPELAKLAGVSVPTVVRHVKALQRSRAVAKLDGYPARYGLTSNRDEAAEAYLRAALTELLSGRDPVPDISAALAALAGSEEKHDHP